MIDPTTSPQTIDTVFTLNFGVDGAWVSIDQTGKITYGPDYSPDEAAKVFWESMGRHVPWAELSALSARQQVRIAELLSELKGAYRVIAEWQAELSNLSVSMESEL